MNKILLFIFNLIGLIIHTIIFIIYLRKPSGKDRTLILILLLTVNVTEIISIIHIITGKPC